MFTFSFHLKCVMFHDRTELQQTDRNKQLVQEHVIQQDRGQVAYS
jgi:hypothetical protein